MLSVVELLGCELAVPDHTTLSRRAGRRFCRNNEKRPSIAARPHSVRRSAAPA
jgi:hypothetical protein